MSRSTLLRKVLIRSLAKYTGKLIEEDEGSDSGFLSGGNVVVSGEVLTSSSVRGESRADESESKTRGSSMLIDSGMCLVSEKSLTDKISELSLKTGLNDLNNPKVQPPVAASTDDDTPWAIYFEQDEDGDTHLHVAIFQRCVEVSLALIRAAPHPRLLDTPNDFGQTPLHLAVETAQYQIVRWLIVAGAKPSPRDAEGDSPLHIAARLGDLDCIRAITEPVQPKHVQIMALPSTPTHEKCKLDQWNYLGQTCIHVAAMHGHVNALKHLVNCGADVNAREGREGYTALHYAAQKGDETTIKYLLSECCTIRPDTTTYGGKNALQTGFVLPANIKLFLKSRGLESPYTSEEESSDDEDEMLYDQTIHRFIPNLVNASA